MTSPREVDPSERGVGGALPRLGASVLGMEAIVLGLTIPVAIVVGGADPWLAGAAGGGLAAGCLVVAGTLRYRWAFYAGGALQVPAIAMGFLVPAMFFLGALFAALWITAVYLARFARR